MTEAQDVVTQEIQGGTDSETRDIRKFYRIACLSALVQLPPMLIVALAAKGDPRLMMAWTTFQAASFVTTAKVAELLDRRDARRRPAGPRPQP